MEKLTDRELLELAAKAARLSTNHQWNCDRLAMSPPVADLVVHDDARELVHTAWNPLTNDSDALRLAVKLKLEVCVLDDEVRVDFTAWSPADIRVCMREHLQDDPYAATRRAIVRAAAAIAMKEQ